MTNSDLCVLFNYFGYFPYRRVFDTNAEYERWRKEKILQYGYWWRGEVL